MPGGPPALSRKESELFAICTSLKIHGERCQILSCYVGSGVLLLV